MPITSLPGNYGIGCFSREAYAFVDWLKESGQTFWQILPIHPTSTEILPTCPSPPLRAIPTLLIWKP